jgi:hypothetical protein
VIAVLCSWSDHHDTKVKLEAATAVVELLMMGGRTPETCGAVNKRHDNKLENFCIWLVIHLNRYKLFLESNVDNFDEYVLLQFCYKRR